ncbi:MAG: energy transducer TonB, partial [Micropepsaceae bacterium]
MRALRFAPYTIATLALTVALVALIGCATPAVLSAENVTPPHPGPAHTPPRDVYPEMSVVQSEEGTVFAQVCVDATGQAISLDITQTSGHERLDQA